MDFELKAMAIQKDNNVNFIMGQSHFIKTVGDLYGTMVNAVLNTKFRTG